MPSPAVLVASLAAALLGLAALLTRRRASLIVVGLLCTAVAGGILGLWERQRASGDCRAGWHAGEDVRLAGTALGYLPPAERGMVRIQPRAVIDGACTWIGSLRVQSEGPVRPGDVYEVRGFWRHSGSGALGPLAPERWGWVAAAELELVEPARLRSHPLLAARGALAARLWRAYPSRWAPLALALVLGQRETVDPDFAERIARAGLAHLLAISGLHVGMLAVGLFYLARTLRLPAARARTATVLLIVVYVGLIGAPASAVRAALMITLWTLARLAGRTSSPFDVLGLSALLLLVARPWAVLEPGFQLSFAGAAAVGYGHIEARRLVGKRFEHDWLRSLSLSLLTSAAAVLLTAPVTAVHFGRVAPAAIVGNLVAIPLLALSMPALFASAITAAWPALSSFPAGAAVLLLRSIDATARLLGSLPGASLEIARPGAPVVAGYLVALWLGAHALHGAWERRRFILALAGLWAASLVGVPLSGRLLPERLVIYVLDVGQGDAIAVRSASGRWLLIDAGPDIGGFNAGKRRVVPFLRRHGTRRLEAWLATHPDLDHVGGGPAVLSAIEVERVIGLGRVTGQGGQVAVLSQLGEREIPWLRAAAGARLEVDGIELVFLHPASGLNARALDPNEESLVFRLEFGGFRMLFTGDVPAAVEARLLREGRGEIEAQVLKVSHHGSATSTSGPFLAAVRPRLAVISVGRGNRYGHPAAPVLRRLAARGIEVRRTDQDGTLVIEARRDGSYRVRAAAESRW